MARRRAHAPRPVAEDLVLLFLANGATPVFRENLRPDLFAEVTPQVLGVIVSDDLKPCLPLFEGFPNRLGLGLTRHLGDLFDEAFDLRVLQIQGHEINLSP